MTASEARQITNDVLGRGNDPETQKEAFEFVVFLIKNAAKDGQSTVRANLRGWLFNNSKPNAACIRWVRDELKKLGYRVDLHAERSPDGIAELLVSW